MSMQIYGNVHGDTQDTVHEQPRPSDALARVHDYTGNVDTFYAWLRTGALMHMHSISKVAWSICTCV